MPVATRRSSAASSSGGGRGAGGCAGGGGGGGPPDAPPPPPGSGTLANPYDLFSSSSEDGHDDGEGEGEPSPNAGASTGDSLPKTSSASASEASTVAALARVPARQSTGGAPPPPPPPPRLTRSASAKASAMPETKRQKASKKVEAAAAAATRDPSGPPGSNSNGNAVPVNPAAAAASPAVAPSPRPTPAAPSAVPVPGWVAKTLLLLKRHKRIGWLEGGRGKGATSGTPVAPPPPLNLTSYLKPILYRPDWSRQDLEECVEGGGGGEGDEAGPPRPRLVVWGYNGQLKVRHDPRTNPTAAAMFRALGELCSDRDISHAYLGNVKEAMANLFHPPGLAKGDGRRVVGVVLVRLVRQFEPALAEIAADFASQRQQQPQPPTRGGGTTTGGEGEGEGGPAEPYLKILGAAQITGGVNHQQQQQQQPPPPPQPPQQQPQHQHQQPQHQQPQAAPWWSSLPGSSQPTPAAAQTLLTRPSLQWPQLPQQQLPRSQPSSNGNSSSTTPASASAGNLTRAQRKRAKKRDSKSRMAESGAEERTADEDGAEIDASFPSPTSTPRKKPRLEASPPPAPAPRRNGFESRPNEDRATHAGTARAPTPPSEGLGGGAVRVQQSPIPDAPAFAPTAGEAVGLSDRNRPASVETQRATPPSTAILGADASADSKACTSQASSDSRAEKGQRTDRATSPQLDARLSPSVHFDRNRTGALADQASIDAAARNSAEDAVLKGMLLEESAKAIDVALSSVSARDKAVAKQIKEAESKLAALQRRKLTLEQRALKLKMTLKRQSSLQKTVVQSLAKSRDSLARLLSSEMTEEEIADLVAIEVKATDEVNLDCRAIETDRHSATSTSEARAKIGQRPYMPTMTLRQDPNMGLYNNKAKQYRARSTRAIELLNDKKYLVPFHEADPATWLSFWDDRDFDFKTAGFVPCLRSERVLREVLDISCREILALDHQQFPDARHRIEALRNTCLDARLLSSAPVEWRWRTSNANPPDNQSRRIGINPSVALCPYELAGVCADPFCPYQHLLDRPVGTLLPREYLALPAPWTDALKSETPSTPAPAAKDGIRLTEARSSNQVDGSIHLGADSVVANADLLPLPRLEVNAEDAESESEDMEADESDHAWIWWNDHAPLPAQTDSCRTHSQLKSVYCQLREYGFDVSDRNFSLATPLDALAGCAFCGKIVEAIRLTLHSGRHDLASSLLSFFGEVMHGWDKTESRIVSFLSRVGLKALSLLRVVQVSVFAFDAVANKNSVRVAVESQMVTAFASFVFLLLYEEIQNCEGTELNAKIQEWGEAFDCLFRMFDGLISADTGSSFLSDMEARALSNSNIQLLFLLFNDMTIAPEVPTEVNNVSMLIESLIQRVQERARQLLKTTLSNVSVRDKYHSHLRVVCQVLHACTRALEWTMVYVDAVPEENVVRGELSLLQGEFNKTALWLERITAWNPTFDLIVTPLFAASASLLSTIQLYDKAQGVLVRLLVPKSDARPNGFHRLFHLSEYLWSQLLQLRMALPSFTRSVSPSDRPEYQLPGQVSEANAQVAHALDGLGAHPHHVCMHGDWNLVKRASQLRIEGVHGLKPFRELLVSQHHSLQIHLSLRDFPLTLRPASPDSYGSSSSFPHVLFLTGRSLVDLDLSSCNLTSLPFHFGHYFPVLEVLYLGMNHLKELPSSLTSIQSLAVLNLDGNRLEALPQRFLFPRLRELSAEGNKLIDLPYAIRDCKELHVLNLRGNQLLSYDFASLATTLPRLHVLTTGTG